MTTPEEILSFWFEENGEEQWFGKDPAFDAEIRARFGAAYQDALAGRFDAWRADPRSCLALVTMLDQFPRNMFRESPRSYEADAKALALAREAVAAGRDAALTPNERLFLYLPFEHSEDLADQRRSVELVAGMGGDERHLDYARRHLVVVERFGRFPHRNAVLGRESTAEEVEFLKEPDSSF